jgi:hypothetical protein
VMIEYGKLWNFVLCRVYIYPSHVEALGLIKVGYVSDGWHGS